MLSYTTAVRLKEAGFPQKVWSGSLVWDKEHWIIANALPEVDLETMLVCPTLGELIEACGDEFACLQSWGNYTKFTKTDKKWCVWDTKKNSQGGDNPCEAVANLWLSLNTKA